jgi:trk system potassium uptake protein TrkH
MNINFRLVLSLLGYLITVMGLLMLVPAFIDLYFGFGSYGTFLILSGLTSFFGAILIISNKGAPVEAMSTKDGLLLTFLSWIIIVLFSATPYKFSYLEFSYTDSFFETMSGITTTGASIITDLNRLSPGFHFWRILLGWIGGVGIIVTGIILIPYMQGGMNVFKVEAFETFDSAFAKAKKIATGVFIIYVFITFLVTFLLIFVANLSTFDSMLHAMSSVSTTGFSNKNGSVGEFNNFKAEIIIIGSMISGGIPYILMYYFIFLRKRLLFSDQQVIGFFKIVLLAVLLIVLWLYYNQGYNLITSIRYSLFSVVSLITGSGFSTKDYSSWGTFPVMILLTVMVIGSCSGSKSAGLKVYRIQIAYAFVKAAIEKVFLPRHVIVPLYNKKEVSNDLAFGVFAYCFLYFVFVFSLAAILAFFGLDFVTAISGSIATISNVGPAFGNLIGPSGNYSMFPDIAKWFLSAGMFLGRLEFFVILAVLNRKFWKN